MLLVASVSFIGCSEDEDDNAQPKSNGKIPGLTASLSTNNGRTIYLSFNDAGGEDVSSLDGYDIYQSENGGEFEKIKNNLKDTSYTNRRTDHGNTYRIYVNFQSMYSDTIEIATAHPAKPWLDVIAGKTGEGSAAVLDYIQLDFFVGEEDASEIVKKFEYFRNEEKIGEYSVPEITIGNDFEHKDESDQLQFDQEYTYYVVAHTKDGEQVKSLEKSITPQRPDEIDRPEPEVEGVSSDHDNELVYIHVNDVSGTSSRIEFYAELNDNEWIWEGEPNTSDLKTDADGNYMIPISTEEAPNGINTLKTKARVYITGQYSGWSDWNVSTIVN
jgi:hypothetical protein